MAESINELREICDKDENVGKVNDINEEKSNIL